jgi:hypothetical protein
VVADPWAEVVGEPAQVAGSGRVPIWAWGLLGIGVLVPLALISVVATVAIPAARKAAQEAVERQRMRDQMGDPQIATKGQNGFQDGFLPPGASPGTPAGMIPPGAMGPSGPIDLIQQSLDNTKKGGQQPAIRPVDAWRPPHRRPPPSGGHGRARASDP